MKARLATALLGLLLGINSVGFVSSVGSKTYETTDGFPDNFLGDLVNSDIVQKKITSRWRWQVWDVVPGTHAFQLYVFNITNPDEVERGGKPSLQQVGPYYYKEYRYKFDVSMNLDLTVNFVRNFSYTFDPEGSHGSTDDVVNVINFPFVIFSTLASKYGRSANINQVISTLVASGESLVKKNVKVQELLFTGMDVSKYQKYLNLIGPSTWLTDEFHDGLYGVLKLKNGVHEGSFTVDSGLRNEKNVGKILTYNERKTLPYWNGDKCNAIMGSDGSVFPPHSTTSDKLNMFEVDFCRSIDFEYKEEVGYNNVMGYKYNVAKDVLADPSVNPDNQCFCSKNNSTADACLKEGVLDVSSCQFGAPFVMSYAHFLDANPEYQQNVVGLKPDPKLHETYVTVELVTGAVIAFHKRYQWNIWIKPIEGIDYFKKFKSMIVPILWNDDIFTLDQDKEELLMEELARQAGGMGGGQQQSRTDPSIHIAMLIITAVYLFGN